MPLRAAPRAAQLFVAPNSVWILAFTRLRLLTGACYAALGASPARTEVRESGV